MAGSYPDVPGYRIAYDRDGSAGFSFHSSGSPVPLSNAELRIMNDESDDFVQFGGGFIDGINVGCVFATPYNIDGYFADISVSNGGVDIQCSTDTTNGQDGSWSSIGSAQWIDRDFPKTNPFYRNNNAVTPPGWTVVSSANAKGVRMVGIVIGGSWGVRSMMFYGTPTGPTDRLQITDPAADARIAPAYFDWGDIASGTQATTTFRVKNLSPTMTATGVAVGIEALTDGTPPLVGMFDFSIDGGATYAASASLANLAPGAISPTVTLRRTMPGLTPVGVWAQRIVASAGAFV